MIFRFLLAGLLVSVFSLNANSATRYISDDLVVYMHSGPSNEFRIIGSAKAGEEVNVLALDSDTQYVHISLKRNNKEGWVEADNINTSPGLKAQLTKTEKQLQETKQTLKSIRTNNQGSISQASEQIESQQLEIDTLESQNAALSDQLVELQERNDDLANQLETVDENIQMQWFIRGGVIAGVGLLLGIIMPYLPRRKKRQDKRWM